VEAYEVPVSRKRPRKEVRLQVTLEGGYSSRVGWSTGRAFVKLYLTFSLTLAALMPCFRLFLPLAGKSNFITLLFSN